MLRKQILMDPTSLNENTTIMIGRYELRLKGGHSFKPNTFKWLKP
ncbi:hypothetical protein [Apilactobacillus timberlakei]|nr:hypothetical protein [Apilactobacillus timberlakei]